MIRHFTKSGKQLNTIEGIIIRSEEFPEVYRVVDEILKRGNSIDEEKNKEPDS